MSNHKIKWNFTEKPEQHWARCQCGWTSGKKATRQPVEDGVIEHHAFVDRVRAYLGTKTPSLKQQASYYRMMANDSNTPSGDRPLWDQLARELEHRLNATGKEDQPTLI